ncbi:hypothetical protein J6590_006091 [Homalodisca vitripennis]|nr:hypothetical protein J6590_006091 [Homalodisca vitripennis]
MKMLCAYFVAIHFQKMCVVNYGSNVSYVMNGATLNVPVWKKTFMFAISAKLMIKMDFLKTRGLFTDTRD